MIEARDYRLVADEILALFPVISDLPHARHYLALRLQHAFLEGVGAGLTYARETLSNGLLDALMATGYVPPQQKEEAC